ncbi:unnamed protein product [Prunus armeniaca]
MAQIGTRAQADPQEGPSKGPASSDAQIKIVAFGIVSALDFCPTSLRDIWTLGTRNADQVDQMAPESSDDCGSGYFVFPEACEDVSLRWHEELTENKGIDGNKMGIPKW